jgi:hypothetical protein
VRLEGLSQLKKIHLIGIRSRDLPSCSIVPQPTTLPRAPREYIVENIFFKCLTNIEIAIFRFNNFWVVWSSCVHLRVGGVEAAIGREERNVLQYEATT